MQVFYLLQSLCSHHMRDALGDGLAVKTLLAHAFECHNAVRHCKKSVVFADANIGAGFDAGTALAHDDLAGLNVLTVGTLHTEIFWLRVAQVFRLAARFLG